MTADFLTRLVERSRGHAPLAQRIEPLIAPLYAKGNTAPVNDATDEEMTSVAEPELRGEIPAPRITESGWPEQDLPATTSQNPESGKIPAREFRRTHLLTGEMQSSLSDPPASIQPFPQTTPKTALSPAPPEQLRTGLADPANKSQRGNAAPVVVRPQIARADEYGTRADQTELETPGETSAPVIRVTIGRIEVRAVNSPTPPARRSAPAAPKLSLEEYLRSRNGGKR